jgi:DNA topoisomerase-1
VLEAVRGRPFTVAAVEERERRRNPYPPFITSTLQQDASRRFGFGARKTMRIAQELYEGLELGGEAVGLITYMRTDSTRVAPQATDAARAWVARHFGQEYLPDEPRRHRAAKGAQDAHEAIRPTDVERRPEDLERDLSPEQLKLYTMVWQRFVASQMAAAVYDATTVDFLPTPRHRFRARGSVLRFPGFVRVYEEAAGESAAPAERDAELPRLREGEAVEVLGCWASSASSTSRSRPRASPRPRWSASSSPTASAGPRPTPRSSPRCSTATTCGSSGGGWSRRCSAGRS